MADPGQTGGQAIQATSLANWNFHEQHIQVGSLQTSYISAESSLIASGPPLLEQMEDAENSVLVESGTGGQDPASAVEGTQTTPSVGQKGDVVFPIGLLENFGLGQNKQMQRVFEIGSARSYFIPGRVIQSLQFGRIFYNGPSLLRSLYAAYKDSGQNPNFDAGTDGLFIGYEPDQSPGIGQFLINLQSDLFNQPFGIAVFFKDARDRWYGGFYCEMCYLQGHQFAISAGSVLIVEGASAQFDNIVPIDITGDLPSRANKVAPTQDFSVGGVTEAQAP